MSLQIWLPLNGNTDNIGLSGPINFTNYSSSSMSWPDSGKIGKTLSLNGGCKKAPFNFNLGNAVSASCWVYYTARPSTNDWMFSFGTSSGTDNTSLGLLTYNTYMVMCIGGLYTNWTYTLETGKWYHFCVTWDGSIATLYKDGEPVLTSTDLNNGTKTSTTYFCLGGNCSSTPTTTTRMKGMLNDVRVYDHCLSPQEVREISQALVLHYKLDGIEPNHIPFDFTGDNWTQHNYSGGQTTSSLEHGVYHVTGYQQDTNKDTSFHLTTKSYITLESDTDYWLSFDCVVSNSLYNIYFGTNSTSYYTGLINSSGTIIRPVSQVTLGQNFSGRVNLKIHTDSDTQYKIRLGFDTPNLNGVGSYIEFSNVMITKIQQNYVPYWYTNNVIYDCSGYSNNGTSTGQIQLDNNTVKYNNCTKILADNSYITFPTRKFQEFTYSFWVKRDRVSQTNREDIIAISHSAEDSFSIVFKTDNTLSFVYNYSPNHIRELSSTTVFNDTSKWYHITVTRDLSRIPCLYINGILENTFTGDTGDIVYNKNYTILGSYTSGSYQFLGSLSDLRIYATALTQEDILDLYHTSSMIDNLGSIHSFDFVEDSINNQEMYDTGIFKTKHFIESNDNLLIDSDGSVFLKILHHNNPASNLFTQENAWLNNDPNLFSNLIILKDSPIFSQLSEYEFIAKEKLTTSSEEVTYRWKQSTNPAALNTTSTEYQVIYGNPPRSLALINKETYGAIHNGTPWWCCCGSWSRYNGGNRGFSGVVTTGYSELYIKIPETLLRGYIDETAKFYTNSAYSKQFLEI